MKKSIKQIVSEHNHVLDTRKRLEKMFSMIAECHVTIGGSYVLKYWCEKAIKAGKKPRYKDVEDIATYESWVADQDLPF